ncbi:vacuolar protein sorting-associated protein 52 A isoform X8 [Triticum aestivum]|uniref:vacuolar protein sorting-associated protein 52 A isoform X8 n=1 Tax=Triticum aestivum TaxID=4565 RepID=UPI001D031916|nr:vacuolar protein sorting-associated protein 52 A-like isoform X8 [Triticum aestivum]
MSSSGGRFPPHTHTHHYFPLPPPDHPPTHQPPRRPISPHRHRYRRRRSSGSRSSRGTKNSCMAGVQERQYEEFFGGFYFDEDALSKDISLDGLDKELEEHKNYDVLISILTNGEKQRDMATMVEGNLGHIEQDLIQDYIKDNDSLVLLHDQIHDCDIVLSQIGSLLSGFQLAETKLAAFVEEIVAPPGLVNAIIDGEVSAYVIGIFSSMRKPGTNIQILQQNLLQKYRHLVLFLKEHGIEKYNDVCAAYVDKMNKVLSEDFRVYLEALESLKLDIGVSTDVIGYDANVVDLIPRGREQLRNHRFMFSLGERSNILKEIDQPGLVPCISEANSLKYPYEVIFRSLQKLLMDTASSEYIFIKAFFRDESMFYRVFEDHLIGQSIYGFDQLWLKQLDNPTCQHHRGGPGPVAVIDENMKLTLANSHDAICLMLMICITKKHQLVMSNRRLPCLDTYLDKALIYLWPRFKTVFDMYIQSLYQCDAKMLWVDGTHPHHIVRCYMEFTASLIQLNAECGDGQLDMSLKRLRLAVDDLLVRFAEKFATQKLKHLFLLNNCDMAISILKEAGEEAKELRRYFEEKLESNLVSFVDELLMEYFGDLIKFVKNHISEDLISYTECPNIADVEPVVKNFAVKWRTALELMHNEVVTCCSNFVSGMAILKAAMAQLLNDYNRLSECVKMIPGGSSLNRNLVSITSISYEIRKYSRTL